MNTKDKKIRVLIATPNSGGPIIYSKLLEKKLPKFGYDIDIVNFSSVERLPKIMRHLFYFFILFFKGLKSDIIYAQDPVSIGLPALFASKLTGNRFFLKIVGDYAWEQGVQRFGVKENLDDFVIKDKHHFFVKTFRYIERFVGSRAEKIIVPSNYLKSIILGWGIRQEKINLVYNAFTKIEVKESRDELRKKFNWNFPVIISAGRLVPWKNFHIVIESMIEILKILPNAKLFIIGDGSEKKNLEKLISEKKIKSSVFILGHKKQEDLYEYIKAADVLTLVSSYEGFSHLIIETLSIGTPVVVTEVGGNNEVIENGLNGIFVPLNDSISTSGAITRIINDETLREGLIVEGQKKVVIFSEENMVKKLALVLR